MCVHLVTLSSHCFHRLDNWLTDCQMLHRASSPLNAAHFESLIYASDVSGYSTAANGFPMVMLHFGLFKRDQNKVKPLNEPSLVAIIDKNINTSDVLAPPTLRRTHQA